MYFFARILMDSGHEGIVERLIRMPTRRADKSLLVLDRPGTGVRAREEFSVTWSVQQQLVEQKCADRSLPDWLLVVEHEPIYTVGRGVEFQKPLTDSSVRWLEVNRGGQATYHGPGQLVCYPIFDLERYGKDVHLFLRKLEGAVIYGLKELGFAGFRREGKTGVWVTDPKGTALKVCSIGVGVKKWVSYHGLALNISPDLENFRAIEACGETGDQVTSLAELAQLDGRDLPSWEEVRAAMLEGFHVAFEIDLTEKIVEKKSDTRQPKPSWLKVRAPGSPEYLETKKLVKSLKLNTVCEEAQCPNIGECWSHHTATFMIMGELCTRRCSFCAVKDGTLDSLEPLDALEPFRVGKAVKELGLEHVVITSVDRDDLPDMGALHFDKTIRQIRTQHPTCRIELLIPDMRGRKELVGKILESSMVAVLNHNVETVPSLYKKVRPGANFERSLNVLRWAKEFQSNVKTKSGLMLGLGETSEEIREVLQQLHNSGVDIITLGQYLQPSQKQLPVQKYVSPAEFVEYEQMAKEIGFGHVESGALVRSSYHAWKHADGAGA
jgi:lipoyl synthase